MLGEIQPKVNGSDLFHHFQVQVTVPHHVVQCKACQRKRFLATARSLNESAARKGARREKPSRPDCWIHRGPQNPKKLHRKTTFGLGHRRTFGLRRFSPQKLQTPNGHAAMPLAAHSCRSLWGCVFLHCGKQQFRHSFPPPSIGNLQGTSKVGQKPSGIS